MHFLEFLRFNIFRSKLILKAYTNSIRIFEIYLRIDKSYTIYLKLLTNFPNLQITAT